LRPRFGGTAFGRDVIDFNKDDTTPTNTGQAIVALDISRFSPVEAFKRNVDEVIREVRNSKRISGVDRIRLSGEQSHATLARSQRQRYPNERDAVQRSAAVGV
jgi:LDH2 family malate/lactate/ureidoglycolate dehydrogenase